MRIFAAENAVDYWEMTPQNKIRVANVLMVVGITPLLLGITSIVAGIAYAERHKGQMGGSDAFLMIGVLLITYVFALIVSGPSALWSTVVTKRNAGARTRASRNIRVLVCIVLLAPLLWHVGLGFAVFYSQQHL